MAAKNKAVFGIYVSQLDAENAVHGLKLAGFRSTDISILFPDNTGTKDLAMERSTKAPEGTAAGAGGGAVVGGILGWLAGIGLLAVPGLGMFVAAGPIMAMLSGIGVGGVLGGITGALAGLGTPEYEAKRYEGRIRKGGILVSVHCDDREWVKSAREILVQTGAEDVSATSEARADFATSDRPRSRTMISNSKA
ncbi:MAG TPA: DUF3341 domain-containing protein [Bryobacteraceae bacterium]|nr:DUF3341 domain-containing protein [Bryobacteraceae bacterium]